MLFEPYTKQRVCKSTVVMPMHLGIAGSGLIPATLLVELVNNSYKLPLILSVLYVTIPPNETDRRDMRCHATLAAIRRRSQTCRLRSRRSAYIPAILFLTFSLKPASPVRSARSTTESIDFQL